MGKSLILSHKHGVNPSLISCFWCGETKGVALVGKLPGDKKAPFMAVYDYEPCDKCKEKMSMGITLMEAEEKGKPTGRWIVVREEAMKHMLTDSEVLNYVLKKRMAYINQEIFDNMA